MLMLQCPKLLFLQPTLLKMLSDIMAHERESTVARRQAGLQLKNYLTSNDGASNAQKRQIWFLMGDATRDYIKKNVLGALRSEAYLPSATAQCVQHIAIIELPLDLWPDLLKELKSQVY